MDPEIFWFEMSVYYSKKTDACGTIPAGAFFGRSDPLPDSVPVVVVVDRRRARRGQETLAAAELAALHLEAHRVLFLATATATGARLETRTRRRDDHYGSRRYHRGRLNRRSRDLLHGLHRGGRDLLHGGLHDLLLHDRLRLNYLHGLRRGGRGRGL